MTSNSSVVNAEGVAAGYERGLVWRDATFSVNRGEFVAVIGPNGAGKTTLFRLLLGLQQPSLGQVRVLGVAPSRGNSRIGYVPQRHTIDGYTNIDCLELVRLGFSGKKWGFSIFNNEDHDAAIRTLESVGASELGYRSLGQLSGGELQRVYLAEALVSNPDILLLDEPLSNLDIRREKELLSLVNKIVRERGVTALLIAHNINPLLPYLDKVLYIANGKVASGTPQEVLTSQRLSDLYGVEIEVLRDSKGNIAIIGMEHHGDQ